MNNSINPALESNIQIAIDALKKNKVSGYELELAQTEGISGSVRLGKTESLQKYLDTNIGITVYNGQKSGYASGSDLSIEGINNLVASAVSIAKYTEADPYCGLAPKDRLAFQAPDLALYHPDMPSVATMIELANTCEATALDNLNINNSEGAELSSFYSNGYYANSHDLLCHSRLSRHSLSCSVIAGVGSDMHTAYDYHNAISWHKLNKAQSIGQQAANHALEKLGSTTLASRTCPIIFSPKMASGFFGNILSGLGGGVQYKKTTFLLDTLDKSIAPNWLSIDERPNQVATLGSRAYDGDGVLKQNQFLIKNGMVQTYIMGQYSANQLGRQSTGNSGGLSNCYVASTVQHGLSQLIKTMDKGLVITELMGQGINITTGNYSRGAAGFWVENGQIQHPVSGITIASNLKDMLNNMVVIGHDCDDRNKIKVGATLIENMTVSG